MKYIGIGGAKERKQEHMKKGVQKFFAGYTLCALVFMSVGFGIFVAPQVALADTGFCYMGNGAVGNGAEPCFASSFTCNADLLIAKGFGGAKWGSSCYEKGGVTTGFIANAGKVVGAGVKDIAEAAVKILIKGLAYLFFQAAGYFMNSMGVLLDFALQQTIDSKIYNDLGVIAAGWTVVRDIANMLFIFVLLYIAITTILGMAGHNTMTMLRNVIIAALLINFSLFFTKMIIDAGNIIAVGFWNNMGKKTVNGPNGPMVTYVGPSETLRRGLDLQEVLANPTTPRANNPSAATKGPPEPNDMTMATIYAGGAILMFIAGYVFLAGAIMMIIRSITLIFLMILSPFAFVGVILPKTAGYASKWWDRLLSEVMVAPVFLAMIYIVVAIVQTGGLRVAASSAQEGATWSALFMGNYDTIALLYQYFIIIGLTLGSLKVAQSVAGETAGMATKFAKKGIGSAYSTGAAGVGIVGRQTVGRYADYKKNDKNLQEQAKLDTLEGKRARMQLASYNKLAKSSFDLRAAPGMKTVGGMTGINFGTAAGVGGRTASRRTHDADVTKRAEELFPNNPQAQEAYIRNHTKKFVVAGESRYEKKPGKYTAKEDKALYEKNKTLQGEKELEKKKDRVKELEGLTKEGEVMGEAAAVEIRTILSQLSGKDAVELLDQKRLEKGDFSDVVNKQMIGHMAQNADKYQEALNKNVEKIMQSEKEGQQTERQYILSQSKLNPNIRVDVPGAIKEQVTRYDTKEKEKRDGKISAVEFADFEREHDAKIQDLMGAMKTYELASKIEPEIQRHKTLARNYNDKQYDDIEKYHTIRGTPDSKVHLQQLRAVASSDAGSQKSRSYMNKQRANKTSGWYDAKLETSTQELAAAQTKLTEATNARAAAEAKVTAAQAKGYTPELRRAQAEALAARESENKARDEVARQKAALATPVPTVASPEEEADGEEGEEEDEGTTP